MQVRLGLNVANLMTKQDTMATGHCRSCCMPSSGAGVVWLETSLSLGQGQTWPFNGLRMIVPSSHFTRVLRKSRKNAVRIEFIRHRGTQGREFEPRCHRQSFLPLLCTAVVVLSESVIVLNFHFRNKGLVPILKTTTRFSVS